MRALFPVATLRYLDSHAAGEGHGTVLFTVDSARRAHQRDPGISCQPFISGTRQPARGSFACIHAAQSAGTGRRGSQTAHHGRARRRDHVPHHAHGRASGQMETLGSLCLSVTGGEPSWIAPISARISAMATRRTTAWPPRGDPLFSMRFCSFLRDFRRTGKTAQSGCGRESRADVSQGRGRRRQTVAGRNQEPDCAGGPRELAEAQCGDGCPSGSRVS